MHCECECVAVLLRDLWWMAWKDSSSVLQNKVYTFIPLSVSVYGSIHLVGFMQCTNKQPVPCVLAEFVHVCSNNWEGQRWTNWFVAVSKIIEQFLSLMFMACCWLKHTLTHSHTHSKVYWEQAVRSNRPQTMKCWTDHINLSQEKYYFPPPPISHPHMLEKVGARVRVCVRARQCFATCVCFDACMCVTVCSEPDSGKKIHFQLVSNLPWVPHKA